LPQTFRAKTGLTHWLEYLAYFVDRSSSIVGLLPAWIEARVAQLAMVSGAVFVAKRAPGIVPLVVFAALQLGAYAFRGPPKEHIWHTYLPYLTHHLLAVIGIFGWIEQHAQSRDKSRKTLRWGIAAGGLAWSLLLAPKLIASADAIKSDFWFGERHRRYETIARWMHPRLPGRQRFLAPEVGTLGFLTRHHMIDPYGLINPTNDFPRTQSLWDYSAFIEVYEPDIVLANSMRDGIELQRVYPFRIVKVFDWGEPWSTLLVRVAKRSTGERGMEPKKMLLDSYGQFMPTESRGFADALSASDAPAASRAARVAECGRFDPEGPHASDTSRKSSARTRRAVGWGAAEGATPRGGAAARAREARR
jgi:hypothetical protein